MSVLDPTVWERKIPNGVQWYGRDNGISLAIGTPTPAIPDDVTEAQLREMGFAPCLDRGALVAFRYFLISLALERDKE